ncbi:GNAT family N-acetyltransferase [Flavobacterium sp.]|uniref:GNAT family N-acetyltransferase n=1 Tax=Flavobacterium sp. TaxID=239 RepID=UPI002EDA7DE2
MMKERYRIEELKKENLKLVVELVRSSFENKYLIPSIYRTKGIEKFISNELENHFSPYRYFVMFENDVIMAYAEYKIFEGQSTAFLNIIAVNNEFKNKGVGKKIYEYTKNKFLKDGFDTIALDVYESNKIALNWYLNFGFIQKKSNSFYEIDIKKDLEHKSKIFIQNFPHYKELQKIYGFYFLDILIENESYKLGTIEQDIIVRGNYSESLKNQLSLLSKQSEINKFYLLGDEKESEELKLIDKIFRMELNLKL